MNRRRVPSLTVLQSAGDATAAGAVSWPAPAPPPPHTAQNGNTMAAATMAELRARLELGPHDTPTEQHVLTAYKAGKVDNNEAKKLQDAIRRHNKRMGDSYFKSMGYDV